MHARIDAIYRVSFAIIGEEADARDSTQETFVTAWRRIRDLRDPERFDAWLQRIAVNAARMTVRARARRRVREIPSGDVAALAAAADRANPERTDPDLLGAALGRLPVDQRTILVLHHLEGHGVAEIAEVLGIPVGTVKSRLHSGATGPSAPRWRPRRRAMTQPDWDDDRVAAAFHARFDRPRTIDLGRAVHGGDRRDRPGATSGSDRFQDCHRGRQRSPSSSWAPRRPSGLERHRAPRRRGRRSGPHRHRGRSAPPAAVATPHRSVAPAGSRPLDHHGLRRARHPRAGGDDREIAVRGWFTPERQLGPVPTAPTCRTAQ